MTTDYGFDGHTLYCWNLMEHLSLSPDFQSLHEAYSSLENGEVDGIMEEMFTAVEFIKRKSNSELSIAHFFEDKHGFGAAIKEDGFSSDVLQCLSTVTEFVSDDIYSNFSAYLKSRTVSIKTLTAIQQAKDRKSSIFSQPDFARPFVCHLFLRVTLNGLGERGTIHRHKPSLNK